MPRSASRKQQAPPAPQLEEPQRRALEQLDQEFLRSQQTRSELQEEERRAQIEQWRQEQACEREQQRVRRQRERDEKQQQREYVTRALPSNVNGCWLILKD